MTWGQNFYTRCAKDEWTAMPNLAALRAAIFLLSAKNRWGGTYVPPPPAVRGLKEIVHLQDMVLNWDSHLEDSVEKKTPTCESFARKHSPAEEMLIFHKWVSFLSFQRQHARRPNARPIHQWLADVQNSRTWLVDEFAWYRLSFCYN